uniref:Uncharacterized protein n=1 Tax=Anguilla anguilla TaxID=7936 RepID=A0A0E9V1D0_ANGAN
MSTKECGTTKNPVEDP